MGEAKVSKMANKTMMKNFVKALLNDVKALEFMLGNEWFEDDVVRIGAEQEMCLVDKKSNKPLPIAMEVLEAMKGKDWVETELAIFNLETGLTPRKFTGSCLSDMEKENQGFLDTLEEVLDDFDAYPLLTGILPTMRKHNLSRRFLTPLKRYEALMDSLNDQMQGNAYELRINGIDELTIKHDSPMLEACNTSFQVHLQVNPENFAHSYNIAQLLAAPTIALASNSPIVFGRRLWHESRIALFQQAIDTRATHEHLRKKSPRVNFGKQWVRKSVLEIYKEDIARFRVLLAADTQENSLSKIEAEEVPRLHALQVHNGTVYRWNRACYGISGTGKPHLRIENRVLPSGPTVRDEMANASFWLGAMKGYEKLGKNFEKEILFDKIRGNFGKAAKYGLETKFDWIDKKTHVASDLILQEILPIAREGLEHMNIDTADIDKYLGIVKERVTTQQNGATWMIENYSNLLNELPTEEATSTLTAQMIKNQQDKTLIHKWKPISSNSYTTYKLGKIRVEDFMETDVFTVQPDDIVELVAEMMDWNMFRYVPVENKLGNLVGLITGRILLRHYIKIHKSQSNETFYIEDIMIRNPITISPEKTVMDAIYLMREKGIGCLPVVTKKNDLIGIITEQNYLRLTGRIIDRA